MVCAVCFVIRFPSFLLAVIYSGESAVMTACVI